MSPFGTVEKVAAHFRKELQENKGIFRKIFNAALFPKLVETQEEV